MSDSSTVQLSCFDQASGENACHASSGHARPPEDVQHIGKYRLIKTIGRGNFAKVKLAKHVPTGRQVNIIGVVAQSFLSCYACTGYECIFVKLTATTDTLQAPFII